jgi:thiol:disulfide interchange protein DsbD
MEVVESVFGIALLVVALVFLSGAVPALRELGIHTAWAPWLLGALVAAGLLAGGVHRSFHGGAGDKAAKGAGVLLIVAAIFLRLHSGPAPATELRWLRSEADAVALGAREGRPVMIDFNAEWCAACKELERITFPDPAVAAELQRFVVASVDLTDDGSPEYERLQKKYGFPGLPYVVFYDSKGKLRSELTVTGFRKPEAFLKVLRRVE